MNVIVCVKRVPLTQEVDLEVDAQKNEICTEGLAWVTNDWDLYAVEEAVRLKEKFGGLVTVISVGCEEDDEVLRRCLAMGADRAIRIEAGNLKMDAFVTSKILGEAIKTLPFDLILTGVQASDNNYGMVGIMLAEHLGLIHAAVVTNIEFQEGAIIRCELEGGREEVSRIELPALLTIQTGINEPRYVTIIGIKKAAKKEFEVMPLTDLNLSNNDLQPRTIVEDVFLPPETEGSELIAGEPSEVADKILQILREKGMNT